MAKFPMPGDPIHNKDTDCNSIVIASSYFNDDIATVVLLNKEAPYYSVAQLSLTEKELEFLEGHDHEHIYYAVTGKGPGNSLGYVEFGGGHRIMRIPVVYELDENDEADNTLPFCSTECQENYYADNMVTQNLALGIEDSDPFDLAYAGCTLCGKALD